MTPVPPSAAAFENAYRGYAALMQWKARVLFFRQRRRPNPRDTAISLWPLFFRPARHPQKARDAQQALHQKIATRQSAPLRRDAHRKQEKPTPAAVPETGQVTLAVFGTTDRAMRLRRMPVPLAAARHCNRPLWRCAQPQEEPASERQRPIRQARGCAAMPHETQGARRHMLPLAIPSQYWDLAQPMSVSFQCLEQQRPKQVAGGPVTFNYRKRHALVFIRKALLQAPHI